MSMKEEISKVLSESTDAEEFEVKMVDFRNNHKQEIGAKTPTDCYFIGDSPVPELTESNLIILGSDTFMINRKFGDLELKKSPGNILLPMFLKTHKAGMSPYILAMYLKNKDEEWSKTSNENFIKQGAANNNNVLLFHPQIADGSPTKDEFDLLLSNDYKCYAYVDNTFAFVENKEDLFIQNVDYSKVYITTPLFFTKDNQLPYIATSILNSNICENYLEWCVEYCKKQGFTTEESYNEYIKEMKK